MELQESLLLSVTRIVEQSGTSIALPWQTASAPKKESITAAQPEA